MVGYRGEEEADVGLHYSRCKQRQSSSIAATVDAPSYNMTTTECGIVGAKMNPASEEIVSRTVLLFHQTRLYTNSIVLKRVRTTRYHQLPALTSKRQMEVKGERVERGKRGRVCVVSR